MNLQGLHLLEQCRASQGSTTSSTTATLAPALLQGEETPAPQQTDSDMGGVGETSRQEEGNSWGDSWPQHDGNSQ